MDIRITHNTGIVFDLDDTLYNEIDYLKSAYAYIAKQLDALNWKPLYARMLSLYRSEEDVFAALGATYDIKKEALLKVYREHVPQITPFEGVVKLLGTIRELKGKSGIITDGRSHTQRAKIAALGIMDLIDSIVISEEAGHSKPSEQLFKLMEERLQVTRYYYIADNLKKDFITPNLLGWETIGLLDNGLNIHHENHLYMDEVHMPMYFIHSLKELKLQK